MRIFLKRVLSSFLVLQFALLNFVQVSWSRTTEVYDPKKVSVAVLPIPSSKGDEPVIEETAEAIRSRLSQISYFVVVDPQTVQSVVRYHLDSIREGSVVTTAERHLGRAKAHWFDREYDEAQASVNAAIQDLRQDPAKGDLLVDALLTQVMIYQETGQHEKTREVFSHILTLNPSLTMAGLPISGRSRRIFNSSRREVLERHSGALEIKSTPPVAVVYLNGVKKGTTPLNITGLPEGSYLITLEANHYKSHHKPVYVTANTTQFIDERLQWVSSSEMRTIENLGLSEKSEEGLNDEVKLAARIGETLKVDKVILVTSQKKDSQDFLIVKTVDTALKSAYNPVGIPFDEIVENKDLAMNRMVDDIDEQARVKVLDHPAKYLEPQVGDIRVLRRKRPFFKTPLFYSLIGAVVGGAIGSTVGVLATKDEGNSAGGGVGGVVVGFE